MKNFAFLLLILCAIGCTGLEKKPSAPSSIFAGKSFSVLLLQSPEGVSFSNDHLHRLVWQWNESSPWFHDQLVGVSQSVLPSGSLHSLLESLETPLKSRSQLLIILQPRRFRLNDRRNPRGSDVPMSEEAEFQVSLVDLNAQREIGVFSASASRSRSNEDSLLDQLAYAIAVKAGFGWR